MLNCSPSFHTRSKLAGRRSAADRPLMISVNAAQSGAKSASGQCAARAASVTSGRTTR
jgi:hypothetical protein